MAQATSLMLNKLEFFKGALNCPRMTLGPCTRNGICHNPLL